MSTPVSNESSELPQDVTIPARAQPGHQRLVLRRGNVDIAGTSINIAAAGRGQRQPIPP